MQNCHLPIFIKGTVVEGCGRGTTELGIPTANLDDKAVSAMPPIKEGVYAAAVSVEGYDGIFPAAASFGTNPHYNGAKQTVEAHIIHTFDPYLFYGKKINIAFIQYIREMCSFQETDNMVSAINVDIDISRQVINSKMINNMKMNAWFLACST